MNKISYILFISAIFLYSLYFWERPIYDPDLGWHLAGGKWIASQLHEGLQQNQFSSALLIPPFDFINSRQNFWHDYHWLIQVVMFKIYTNYNYFGLLCFYSIIFTLTILIIWKISETICLTRKLDLWVGLLATLAATYLLKDVSSVRPQLVSFLFISTSALILLGKEKNSELLILFIFSALLVNIHVYWVFIPFLYFCFRLIPSFINKNNTRRHLVSLFFICLAGFISPYGIFTSSSNFSDYFLNYFLILEYLQTDSFLKNFITEFLSGVRGWSLTTLFVLIYLISIIRFLDFKKMKNDLGLHLAGIISLILIYQSVKFSSIFAIFALISWLKIIPSFTVRYNYLLSLLVILLINLTLLLGVLNRIPSQDKINADLELFTPLNACRSVITIELPSKPYQILTEFTHGGWCYWAIYEQGITNFQVTTDGRTQGIPIQDYKDSYQIYSLQEGWNKTLIAWSPDFILASRSARLAHVLPFFPNDWKNIYIDRGFALYGR